MVTHLTGLHESQISVVMFAWGISTGIGVFVGGGLTITERGMGAVGGLFEFASVALTLTVLARRGQLQTSGGAA